MQVRRSKLGRRNANDDYVEQSILWNRDRNCARRSPQCHSHGCLLSWLAGIARFSGETCRAGDSGLANARNKAAQRTSFARAWALKETPSVVALVLIDPLRISQNAMAGIGIPRIRS